MRRFFPLAGMVKYTFRFAANGSSNGPVARGARSAASPSRSAEVEVVVDVGVGAGVTFGLELEGEVVVLVVLVVLVVEGRAHALRVTASKTPRPMGFIPIHRRGRSECDRCLSFRVKAQ